MSGSNTRRTEAHSLHFCLNPSDPSETTPRYICSTLDLLSFPLEHLSLLGFTFCFLLLVDQLCWAVQIVEVLFHIWTILLAV